MLNLSQVGAQVNAVYSVDIIKNSFVLTEREYQDQVVIAFISQQHCLSLWKVSWL